MIERIQELDKKLLSRYSHKYRNLRPYVRFAMFNFDDAELSAGHCDFFVNQIPSSSKTVLVFGAGLGYLAEHIKKKLPLADIIAVEHRQHHHAYLKTLQADKAIFKKVIRSNRHEMPEVKSGSVDVVVIDQALRGHDIPLALREFCRVLRPGGKLVMVESVGLRRMSANMSGKTSRERFGNHLKAIGFGSAQFMKGPRHWLLRLASGANTHVVTALKNKK